MNGAMDIGAVALRAQQRALDTIANNVANVNTPTYKRVDSSFSEVMGRQIQPASQTALLASRELLPAGGVRFSPQDATRYDYWKRMEFTEEQWAGLAKHAPSSARHSSSATSGPSGTKRYSWPLERS